MIRPQDKRGIVMATAEVSGKGDQIAVRGQRIPLGPAGESRKRETNHGHIQSLERRGTPRSDGDGECAVGQSSAEDRQRWTGEQYVSQVVRAEHDDAGLGARRSVGRPGWHTTQDEACHAQREQAQPLTCGRSANLRTLILHRIEYRGCCATRGPWRLLSGPEGQWRIEGPIGAGICPAWISCCKQRKRVACCSATRARWLPKPFETHWFGRGPR